LKKRFFTFQLPTFTIELNIIYLTSIEISNPSGQNVNAGSHFMGVSNEKKRYGVNNNKRNKRRFFDLILGKSYGQRSVGRRRT
jgi:hypothetical protein